MFKCPSTTHPAKLEWTKFYKFNKGGKGMLLIGEVEHLANTINLKDFTHYDSWLFVDIDTIVVRISENNMDNLSKITNLIRTCTKAGQKTIRNGLVAKKIRTIVQFETPSEIIDEQDIELLNSIEQTVALNEETQQKLLSFGILSAHLQEQNSTQYINYCTTRVFDSTTAKKIFLGLSPVIERSRKAIIIPSKRQIPLFLHHWHSKLFGKYRPKTTLRKGKNIIRIKASKLCSYDSVKTTALVEHLLKFVKKDSLAIVWSKNQYQANNTRVISRHDFAFRIGPILLFTALKSDELQRGAKGYIAHSHIALRSLNIPAPLILTDANHETSPLRHSSTIYLSSLEIQPKDKKFLNTHSDQESQSATKLPYYLVATKSSLQAISKLVNLDQIQHTETYLSGHVFSQSEVMRIIAKATVENATPLMPEPDLMLVPPKYLHIFKSLSFQLSPHSARDAESAISSISKSLTEH